MSYAQPYNIITPSPCQVGYSSYPWQGPKWDTVCTNHYYSLQCESCDNCCYIIKYYDREKPGTLDSRSYETNVVGIFYYGKDCELRERRTILLAFYDKLLKSKPDGYIGHLFDPPNDDGTLSMDQYTVGACYQKDMNGDI